MVLSKMQFQISLFVQGGTRFLSLWQLNETLKTNNKTMKGITAMKTFTISTWIKLAIWIVLLVIQLCSVHAQYSQQWVNNIGNAVTNTGVHTVTDPSGNIYVGNGGKLVKYNHAGAQLFTNTYSSLNIMAIQKDLNHIYVSGRVSNSELFLKKITFSGTEVFNKNISMPGNYVGILSIAVEGTGDIYIAGFKTPSGNFANGLLMKFDPNGNQLWESSDYRAPVSKVMIDNQGNVFICGKTDSPYSTQHKHFIYKYSSSGTSLWTRIGNDGTTSRVDMDLNYFGNAFVISNNGIFRYLNDGTLYWSINTFNGSTIAVDNDNFVIAAGIVYNAGSSNDVCTIKLDINGNEMWRKIYSGPAMGIDHPSGIAVNNTNSIYVTGSSQQYGQYNDIFMLRYLHNGQLMSTHTYNNPSNLSDDAAGVNLINNISAVVTGFSGSDVVVIKYADITGITNQNEIPGGFSLKQNYPNPFNPNTKIGFSIPKAGFVKMAVYDITGKEVEVLVNENLSAGSFEVDFNASKLTSGVYFCKISAGEFTDVKKMILTK